jgi:hypothetical protein
MNISAIDEFKKYKPYFQHAKLIASVNRNIAVYIISYALRMLSRVRDRLEEKERRIFDELLVGNNIAHLKVIETNVGQEEYFEFVESFFNRIDQEERNLGNTPLELAVVFRIIEDLINIIVELNGFSEEWVAKSMII